ncbi:MAG: hypothetical protein BWY57_02918 [Betaproteobacteria bacterium ADurb.Bin341]|nr:MAG: hypothetical protein BWY57_02918 [Betaproteobacteria bacterium ADurb.Bin341]
MSNWKVGPGGRLYHPTTGAYVGQLDDNGNEQMVVSSAFPSDQGVGNVAGVVAASPLGDFRPSLLASLVSGATYGQAGNTVTVIATAHGLPTNRDGYRIFWPGSAAIAPGWYDGFAYVDANTFIFQSAESQTVSAGTAITGALPYVTSTTLASASAPGKLLGKNGRVSAMITASGDATAGQKDTRLAINGSGISAAFHLAACNSTYSLTVVNANSYNKQVGVSSQDGTGTSTASTVATQDTSVEFTVSVTAKLQNASQWRAYDHVEIQVVTLP